MIKTFEELRKSESLENLYKYYNESLGKSIEEIKALLKGYGVEVSDECLKECYNFCKGFEAIKDDEVDEIAGGIGDASVPERARHFLNSAIKKLDNERFFNTEPLKYAAKECSETLKNLLNQPYEKESFKNALTRVLLEDIGLLVFSNNAFQFVASCIQEAQRSL